MSRVARLVPLMAALVLAAIASAWHPSAVAAADPVEFGTPTADSTYGTSIDFKQPVDLATKPARIELLLRTPDSQGPGVIDVDTPTRTGSNTLNFSVDLADGHIVPNTTFTAQWRVTDADGKAWLGPKVSETYADTSVDWKTLQGDVVRVHWYEGSDDFGRRALKIGDDAVAQTSQLLGVTETQPIDFFIYADQDKFYEALGPATRENVGGEAHADIRTMFALITPAEINDSWVGIVVPHELTHLVFDTATKNPYHEPPHWLNEGLAVYLSQGYDSSDRGLVEGAARDGTIMPLDGLIGAFPTTRDRFFLAYAESVSAVDWIVANKGRDALIALIRSYADGVSDDEAFKAALGMDSDTFQQAWLDAYGATAPVRHGPQPAPVGPLPQGWSGAAPAASNPPGASVAPGGGTDSPIEQPSSSSGLSLSLPLVLGLAAVGLVLVAGVIVASRRRPRAAAAPAADPWAPSAPPPAAVQPSIVASDASRDVAPPEAPVDAGSSPAPADAPPFRMPSPPDEPAQPAPAESPESRPPASPEP
jgi:hypothetical protein